MKIILGSLLFASLFVQASASVKGRAAMKAMKKPPRNVTMKVKAMKAMKTNRRVPV